MSYTTAELRDYNRSDTDAMLDWAADEIDRLAAEFNAANNRFHAMNSPTGREIELQAENQRLQAIVDRLLAGIDALSKAGDWTPLLEVTEKVRMP